MKTEKWSSLFQNCTYWHSLNQNFKDTIVVNSFLFQRSTGKLAIDSHSFVSGYNKKYYMLCDEAY